MPYNYRKCGILDTLGNVLCIDSHYSCPINSLIADYEWKESQLSFQRYTSINISTGLSYNYRLYYSKDYYNSKAIVNLIKTYYKPKFLNRNNFYFDLDAIKEIFGSFDEQKNDDSEDKDNEENKKDEKDNGRRRIESVNEHNKFHNENNSKETNILENIYYVYNNTSKKRNLDAQNIIGEINAGLELIEKITGSISSLDKANKRKSLIKFIDYVYDKIDEDENYNDIYYKPIGDNFYVKNYIGFNNISDLDKFLEFDFDLYKRNFPNRVSAVFAIICFIIFLIVIVINLIFFIILISEKNNNKKKHKVIKYSKKKKESKYNESQYNEFNFYFQLVTLALHTIVFFGFFIYSCVIYNNVYMNKNLDELLKIKSDIIINNFINEYVSKFKSNSLIVGTIIILLLSFILEIIGFIVSFILLYFCEDNSNSGSSPIEIK